MSPAGPSLPRALLGFAVRVLPAEYRPRYRMELAAELADIPTGQQLRYVLRVLLRSVVLRSALSRYQPTIGETLMAASSSPFDNELHHRQQVGDYGHAVLGSTDRVGSRKRWKTLLFPVVLMVLGLILGMWGPVPGLGLILLVAGIFALVPIAISAFNDMFS